MNCQFFISRTILRISRLLKLGRIFTGFIPFVFVRQYFIKANIFCKMVAKSGRFERIFGFLLPNPKQKSLCNFHNQLYPTNVVNRQRLSLWESWRASA